MDDIKALVDSLDDAQQSAIQIIKTALDCYNSYEGTGLFIGASRYDVLTARIEIAAIQSRSLIQFWSTLQRRMNWGITRKEMDAQITSVLSVKEPQQVLLRLSTETACIVMIARMLHDVDKKSKRLAGDELKDDVIDEVFK